MGTSIRISGIVLLFFFFFASGSFAGDTTEKKTIPSLPQAERLQKALNHYYEIRQNGGWEKINATQKFYMKGQTAPAIKQIKERLRASGDFTSKDTSSVFTNDLVKAIQKIQKRFGQKQNGVVDAWLIKELNRPVEERIQQLEANLERLQTTPALTNGTNLIVNIPEFKLHVYEGSTPVFDMDIVVGSESHQTVIFHDEMTHIVFSPYWNVPENIVKNELLPAIRKNRNYLRNNDYEITGYENGLPVIRQKPGKQNSLGRVKFVFPNPYGIYFHDTPAKGLFEYPKRTFSHGCIRLAEPTKLAEYLLRNSPQWNKEKIKDAMNSGREQWVKLNVPVAVALTYFTAWVDDEGHLNWREDVYGLDKKAGYKTAGK